MGAGEVVVGRSRLRRAGEATVARALRVDGDAVAGAGDGRKRDTLLDERQLAPAATPLLATAARASTATGVDAEQRGRVPGP